MAEVTVVVNIRKEFTVNCDGTDEDECMDDIRSSLLPCYSERLDKQLLEACYDAMEFREGTFDEPEPDDDSEGSE